MNLYICQDKQLSHDKMQEKMSLHNHSLKLGLLSELSYLCNYLIFPRCIAVISHFIADSKV